MFSTPEQSGRWNFFEFVLSTKFCSVSPAVYPLEAATSEPELWGSSPSSQLSPVA